MKKNKLIINILLSLGTILVLSCVLELGLRAFLNEWGSNNFSGVFKQTDPFFKAAYPGQFDTNLGWIPKPNFTGAENIWKTEVTLLNEGIRSNGSSETFDALDVILAVGDSYTFGDTVSDSETWPAVLEKKLGYKVINGGVFGYGIDQSFLRMKSLYEKYQPDIIIFSFIPDDINRCELAMRGGVLKPYFDIDDNDQLILKNNPLPLPEQEENRSVDIFRRIFGYSFFIHKVMIRAAPYYWYAGGSIFKTHKKGSEVACLIMKQLADFSKQNGVKILVLNQHRKYPLALNTKKLVPVIKCIKSNISDSFLFFDLSPGLTRIMREDSTRHDSFYRYKNGGHMTAEGNRYVAGQLELFIRGNKNFID